MPFVALDNTGMTGRGAGLSPEAEPIDTRLMAGAEVGAIRAILRGFFEAMALRSLRMSIAPDSESEPEAFGGLFSSMTVCKGWY
jgi:hypothetical protein